MRIAVLADIHGNLTALDAALADIRSLNVDHVVFCGDALLGAPDDRECWQCLGDTSAHRVRGNTEGFVARYGTPEADPKWTTEQWGPLQWAVSQFSDNERQAMGELPLTLRLQCAPEVLFCHASARNDRDLWRMCTPEDRLAEYYAGTNERVIVGGHNHTQCIRPWGDRLLVLCGSVGLTNDWSARGAVPALGAEPSQLETHTPERTL